MTENVEEITTGLTGEMAAPPISTSWHSYPSLLALGHRLILDIFADDVVVEEKIDGSQFSWGIFNGELKARSKGTQLNLLAPEKMFQRAIDICRQLAADDKLVDGWTYRAEYLRAPKHNTLAYDRIPVNHLIGFDINTGHEAYMPYEQKVDEFAKLGLETVPLVYSGKVEGLEMFREFLERVSILGGQKVEGVVIKNYSRFTQEKKIMIGKFVSEAFKEVHQGSWRERNPGQKDIVEIITAKYRTPARWAKGVQHLRDEGKLENSPKDIGALLHEVQADILKEAEAEIREELFKWSWPKISRGVILGLPQWYKEELVKLTLNEIGAEDPSVKSSIDTEPTLQPPLSELSQEETLPVPP